MNKLANALLISLLATVLIGCSSGSSDTGQIQSISGTFSGSFENTQETQDGTATFNLAQAENSNSVTGNAIFDLEGGNTCLISGTVEGTVTGFTASLDVSNVNFQLNIADNGNSLSGTYVLNGDVAGCSGPTGSGNISLTRS